MKNKAVDLKSLLGYRWQYQDRAFAFTSLVSDFSPDHTFAVCCPAAALR
jgi:hypothetical protein